MSESGGEIPVNLFSDLHKSDLVKKAIELAKLDGNLVNENSKKRKIRGFFRRDFVWLQ